MNEILGERTPHLHLYSSLQFRIRGGQHLQTGNCERDAWNMNRASQRGISLSGPRGLRVLLKQGIPI